VQQEIKRSLSEQLGAIKESTSNQLGMIKDLLIKILHDM